VAFIRGPLTLHACAAALVVTGIQVVVVVVLITLQLAQGSTLETSLGGTPSAKDSALSLQLYNYYIGVALMMFIGFGARFPIELHHSVLVLKGPRRIHKVHRRAPLSLPAIVQRVVTATATAFAFPFWPQVIS
jgi:hypothetical protein